MTRKRLLLPLLGSLLVIGAVTASTVPWEELTPSDWLYAFSTRFALVEGHQVHYPTPTAELAKALEASQQAGALRELADARLALGDRKGATEALQAWASKSGTGEAWAEAARWSKDHGDYATAFQDAARALPSLPGADKAALASERVQWADQHPDLADPIQMRQESAALFPKDGTRMEDWVRALEKAGRLDEAGKALASSQALDPERRLLLASDLRTDHQDARGAFLVLDAAADQPWSAGFRRAYATKVDAGAPSMPIAWRATLDNHYDAHALARLATYFEGKDRGDAVAGLLDQVERRYGKGMSREDDLLLARLRAEVDAIPESFRALLAAAQQGKSSDQAGDIAALAHLALRAGGRPLPWGSYNDEAYRWAASTDRTPGFWTGGLSFFLTGQSWKDALDRLESESLPDRTFGAARALCDLLARRAPDSPELAPLRVAIMARFVERGEGREALKLLPLLESAPPAVADDARRVALLAARQVPMPIAEESRLYKARLAFAAPKGTKPSPEAANDDASSEDTDPGADTAPAPGPLGWARAPRDARQPAYADLLNEAIARLEERDPSHRASLDLCLTELDRLPDDEALWLSLASRLEGWNLDDDLGPRLQGALQRFNGPGIWDKAARWYARRSYQADLRKLGEDLAARFRGSDLFDRAGSDALVDISEQAQEGHGSLVSWADFVRLKALERFPHSPRVFAEASRLMPASEWRKDWAKPTFRAREAKAPSHRVLVPDALLEQRWWATLFVDESHREAYLSTLMKQGSLEAKLDALEAKPERTPVEDQLLFEGRARLSQFERAMAPADRLAAAYPGDGDLAARVLSLHRSLDGLDGAQSAPARALVERTAPALEDPNPLWTSLGELEEDRGHPQAAIAIWKHLLDREPRDPDRVSELATLLWDYNHDREALEVVEQGRKAMGRPRFFAFETGVLRENEKDIQGAIQEYLDALEPEDESGYGSWFEQDQRSLRRLSQLIARPKVFDLVQARIASLKPGNAEDEHALAAFFPIATIETPAPGLDFTADDWIDDMDQPNDPVGRDLRAARMAKARPKEHDAIQRLGSLLLAKSRDMAAQATAPGFLDAVEAWSEPLVAQRWKEPKAVQMHNLILSRRAALAPTEEDRIRQEMDRATYLAAHARGADADALWAQLSPRIGALPEGVTRMRAESERAAYLERAKGPAAASAEWDRLSARYPWSLGVLEDHAAFLDRSGQGDRARALIEAAVPKAGPGHREALLARLTQDSLAATDLPRARRAVDALLADPDLEDGARLSAIHLAARLSWREKADWDPAALIQAQKEKLKPELHADLYHELAVAADDEHVAGKSLSLWIEALNRRTGRDWVQAAARSTRRAGTEPQLLAFFEKQQQRSPRDVRWAVAVRDLRRDAHDVDGAIQAAQSAVAVRPEEEILWREAADLMVRAGRVKAAADYLAGWAKSRPGDEGVAGWRSGLYSQAGDGAQAFDTEKAALAAFRKASPEATPDECNGRLSRAIGRLMDQGHPDLALRLGSAKGDIRALDGVMSLGDQCRLALLNGQLARFLSGGASRGEVISAAASVLRQTGRLEWQEEAEAFVLQRILPNGQSDDAALGTWWPLVAGAGLEAQTRVALARRFVAQQSGPWQSGATVPFLETVGAGRIGVDRFGHLVFLEPDLNRAWTHDLARRDEGEALWAFLQPRWTELLALVEGPAHLDANSESVPMAGWLNDPTVLQTWARAAANHPESAPLLARLMGDRYHWDRFWAAAARGWATEPLVSLLPDAPRMAWFRLWESDASGDPVKVARRKTAASVSEALAHLIEGQPGAVSDPLIVKLRGPQTVGAVLGHDAAWVWAEFTPRRDAKGNIAERGEDRVTGQGLDEGREPGALWGERPGEAWFVLEALARYRAGDRSAPYLPLEPTVRGAETPRTLLAIRMARAMGDLPLAMELEAGHPGLASDHAWIAERISLLKAAGQGDQAADQLRATLRAEQSRMDEAEYRWAAALAEDNALPDPLALLDATKPVPPAFLAYLADRRPADASRFHTDDPTGYLQALSLRWQEREGELDAPQIHRWMTDLWAQHAADLPSRGSLAKLGPVWRHAAAWLSRQDLDRAGALKDLTQALAAGGDAAPFFARLAAAHDQGGSLEDDHLLAVRIHLARHEQAEALKLAEAMLDELKQGKALSFDASDSAESAPSEGPSPDEDASGDAGLSSPQTGDDDALAARLRTWLAPFRAAHAEAALEPEILGLIQDRREAGPVSPGLWRLDFELTPPEQRPALAKALDEAWFRGDVAPDQAGALAEVLAKTLPSEAPTWLDRWPRQWSFDQAARRARILIAIHRGADAAKVCTDTRRVAIWTSDEEWQAFNLWRRAGSSPSAPVAWRGALPAWQGKADGAVVFLQSHLMQHPLDGLAARAALRALDPAPEDTLALARLALPDERTANAQTDRAILALRAARGALPGSWRAARAALGGGDAASLARLLSARRYRSVDINAALADLARIAFRAGDTRQVHTAFKALQDRRAPNAKALRAELSAPSGKVAPFLMEGGRPKAILPRDLNWTLLAKAVRAGGAL